MRDEPATASASRHSPFAILKAWLRRTSAFARPRDHGTGCAGQSGALYMWVIAMLILAATGCSLTRHNISTARDDFHRGELTSARASLESIANSHSRGADTAALDLAIVELASGNPRSAEQRLREIRDRFDALPAVAPIGATAALVTDDNARRFRPAGYEQVMIRAMLAVCSIAGDASDAESYALQASIKQEELALDAKERGAFEIEQAYQPIAITPYLRGVLREATHHDFDDAVKAYQLVSHVEPTFAPAKEDIVRATLGAHSAPGTGVLYVFACTGRGPVREEKVAETTSAALSIASSVLNAETNKDESGRVGGPVLPNIASVKVPDVVIPPSPIEAVGVRVGGVLYGATQTVTDVGRLAHNQVNAEMPWTIARAVTRRVTKETLVAGTRNAIGLEGAAGSLVHFAAATAWSATEHADTRCWGLLPREIQVLRAEICVGVHDVQLSAMNSMGHEFGTAAKRRVSIVDGQNTYLVVVAPAEKVHLAN